MIPQGREDCQHWVDDDDGDAVDDGCYYYMEGNLRSYLFGFRGGLSLRDPALVPTCCILKCERETLYLARYM